MPNASSSLLSSCMQPTRLGVVRYLNTAPLIEGLHKLPQLSLSAAVPSCLIDMLTTSEVDIALASVIDAARPSSNPDSDFILIPAGMIGCDGPTLTVRLFSSVPFDRVRRIHADTDSHTSVALARIILHRLHGLRPDIIDFDARERMELGTVTNESSSRGSSSSPVPDAQSPVPASEWPETLLLIGDKVVTDPPPASLYPHQLDLGEEWHKLTGLPFVYAMWMCRARDLADPAKAPAIATAASILDRQLRHNLTRLDWLIEHRAADHRWPIHLARRYVGELLRYRVGPRERSAVGAFFDALTELNIIAARPPRWFEPSQWIAAPSPSSQTVASLA